jgi:hypothetical protein
LKVVVGDKFLSMKKVQKFVSDLRGQKTRGFEDTLKTFTTIGRMGQAMGDVTREVEKLRSAGYKDTPQEKAFLALVKKVGELEGADDKLVEDLEETAYDWITVGADEVKELLELASALGWLGDILVRVGMHAHDGISNGQIALMEQFKKDPAKYGVKVK